MYMGYTRGIEYPMYGGVLDVFDDPYIWDIPVVLIIPGIWNAPDVLNVVCGAHMY